MKNVLLKLVNFLTITSVVNVLTRHTTGGYPGYKRRGLRHDDDVLVSHHGKIGARSIACAYHGYKRGMIHHRRSCSRGCQKKNKNNPIVFNNKNLFNKDNKKNFDNNDFKNNVKNNNKTNSQFWHQKYIVYIPSAILARLQKC